MICAVVSKMTFDMFVVLTVVCEWRLSLLSKLLLDRSGKLMLFFR